MYCGKCGVQTADRARFCQRCGALLPEIASQTEIEYPEHNPNETKIAEAQPYEEAAQIYPHNDIAEYSPVQEFPSANLSDIPEVEIKKTSFEKNPPLFPETVPDSFPNPTMTAGSMDVNSYRRDFNTDKNSALSEEIKQSEYYIKNNASIETNELKENFTNQQHEQNTSTSNENTTKERVYFGKPAFVFCIIIITILSVLCGVFAGLYLKSTEKSRLNTNVSGIASFYNNGDTGND